jgi:hypothetical protein
MEIMVQGCITAIVKTTVQFNGQLALLDPPPISPLNQGFTVFTNKDTQKQHLTQN